MPSSSEELDLFKVGRLTFARPDEEKFPLLRLAKEAIAIGGAGGAVLNAADEVAVGAFLRERISFEGIFATVNECFDRLKASAGAARTLDEILSFDKEARRIAENYIGEI